MNTDQLIKRCKTNDYKAQMLVYNNYKQMMFGVAYRILNHRESAEDMVHEAFITGFEKIHQLENDGYLGGWLKRIVVNKALDFVKMEKRLKWVDTDLIAADKEDLTDEIEPEVSVEIVKKCLSELKEKYRIVLNLYLIENYSHREISDLLGIKESTIRNQYKRGKEKLIELIKNHQKDEN